MNKRFDITVPKEGKNGKNYYTRIGTAFENDKGFTLYFDALPTADKEGVTKALMFEAKAKDASASGHASPSALDDEIPFSASK